MTHPWTDGKVARAARREDGQVLFLDESENEDRAIESLGNGAFASTLW